MTESSSCALANAAWLASCLPSYLEFRRALKNPEGAQAAVLSRLLQANAGCDYGRRRGFSRLRSPREFQEAVPISRHEDLEAAIERIKDGEPGVLTSEPVLMLEKTSGTSSAAKYIPYTASLRREFQKALAAWIFDLYANRPALCAGSAYWSITPIGRRREMTRGGLPVGFESDAEYLSGFEQRLLRRLLAVPAAVARVPDLDDGLYVTLRFLLQSPELAFVSIWNPSFASILLDRLNHHAERLLDDLRDGALNPPSELPPGVLALLRPHLRADARRARDLELELKREGRLAPASVWPRLRLISCWADAQAKHGVPAAASSFPGVELQPKGLLATEGVVSIPLLGRSGAALAVTSHFYEFLEGSGRPRLAHELEAGREYRILLTTGGGLWRYDLGDVVRVTGFEGRTPRLEFIGRGEAVCDLAGEKLNAVFVGEALDRLKAEGAWSGRFAMLAPAAEGPAYALFVEGRTEARLAQRLDALLRANPHYDYCRALGQLEAPLVYLVSGRAEEAYLRRCELLGQRAGGVKPVPLHPRRGWERVFDGRLIAEAA
ncbi:MAG: GH3 auxin-responsive promoter family protein [Elusimicrobia bacterium]|nr:GH3 auxin-responsive promoter family protein [Elusimicrobiota bacterium]